MVSSYRIVLSDSTHFIQAMLSTRSSRPSLPLVPQAHDEPQRRTASSSPVNCKRAASSSSSITTPKRPKTRSTDHRSRWQRLCANELRILIIIELEVLKAYGSRDKVGNPTGLEAATAGQTSAAPVYQEPAAAPSFYGNNPAPQRNAPIPATALRAAHSGGGGAA